MAEKWRTCNLIRGHAGHHQEIAEGAKKTPCGVEFIDSGQPAKIVRLQSRPYSIGGYVSDLSRREIRNDELPRYGQVPWDFKPVGVGEFSPAPAVPAPRMFAVPDEEAPALVAELDPNASIRENALRAKAGLDELGISADQAMAIIMVTIASADDVREESSKWLTRFTTDVMTIVAEAEEEAGDER